MARKSALKDMTFLEFRERLPEKPVILLPLGSQEEQGPHAPMGDYMLSERLALMVGEASDAIVTPTLPFGYADVFRCVPGGIQLRPEVFCGVLEDMITAFLDHGLERIVIFNGHTGNSALIDQTVRRLKRERGLIVPSINIWQIIPPAVWEQAHGANAKTARGHGADPISSVYHYLFPELLRLDLMQKSGARPSFGLKPVGLAALSFDGVDIQVPLDALEVNAYGMLGGDAGHSNAEAGKIIADHVVDVATRFIRHFAACDPRDLTSSPAVSPG